jgi:hypothetical protein
MTCEHFGVETALNGKDEHKRENFSIQNSSCFAAEFSLHNNTANFFSNSIQLKIQL